jgi:hypothetical protein
MTTRRGTIGLLVAASLAGRPMLAQYGGEIGEATRVTFLFAVGSTFPLGGIASRVDPGGGGLLGVLVRPAGSTFGVRFDDTYSYFSGSQGWVAVDAISFAATWMSSHQGPLHWYGMLGAGPYYTTGSALSAAYIGYHSQWSLGLNGGAGVMYGRRLRVLLEARYNLMFQGGRTFQAIPVMVGLAFPLK